MADRSPDEKEARARSGTAAVPAEETRGPQQLRSERTRKRLIEVTIACLVRDGYARTNPLRVAAEAGVTRGAVLHHFQNGAELIRATIIALQEKRLRALGRVSNIRPGEVRTIVRTYFAQLETPTAIAFQELRNAARTDEALLALLEPLEREYQRRWDERSISIFADWQSDPESFEIAMALSQTVIEGVALRRQTNTIGERASERVLDYLEQRLIDLHPSLRGRRQSPGAA